MVVRIDANNDTHEVYRVERAYSRQPDGEARRRTYSRTKARIRQGPVEYDRCLRDLDTPIEWAARVKHMAPRY